MNQCPDCGKIFSGNVKRCSCGWINTESKASTKMDYRCVYITNGERCKQLGTISHSARDNNNWYCSPHYHALKNSRYSHK